MQLPLTNLYSVDLSPCVIFGDEDNEVEIYEEDVFEDEFY